MMPETLTCQIKNDLSEIAAVSQAVDDFVARHELPARVAFDLNLALEEILTNAISYGYDVDDDTGEHSIHIRGTMADGLITLEVEDDGRPFNPLEAANEEPDIKASIEDRPIGGLGLFMVRKLMDQLEYHRRGEKNLLVMKKLVSPQQLVS